MKDLWNFNNVVVIEVHSRVRDLFLNHHKYIKDLIQLVGLKEAIDVDTPREVNVKYRKDEGSFCLILII